MKKLFLALTLSLLFTSCVLAQSTSPRYGLLKNQDNTGRVLTYGSLTVTPTGTLVTIRPNAYTSLITIATTSLSPTFTVNVGGSYLSDKMDLLITLNATGTRTLTFSTNLIGTATTMTVAASKQALLTYIFDGAKWMEISRSVQP